MAVVMAGGTFAFFAIGGMLCGAFAGARMGTAWGAPAGLALGVAFGAYSAFRLVAKSMT